MLTLKSLLAEHPGVYDEAVAVGAKAELSRVMAHLKLGEQSGAMSSSIEHIKEGREVDSTVLADHAAANMAAFSAKANKAAEAEVTGTVQPVVAVNKDEANIRAAFKEAGMVG
jgi:hypothetical protein